MFKRQSRKQNEKAKTNIPKEENRNAEQANKMKKVEKKSEPSNETKTCVNVK